MTATASRSRFAIVCAALAGCASLETAPVIVTRPPEAAPITLPEVAGASAAELRVTRIAHASVLLDFDGAVVLTDPWFSEKAGYHHGEPLGLSLEALPRLSAVVASHAHYDHFDIETFARYPHKDVPMFVGPDMVGAARAHGFTNVRELRAWESATAGDLAVTGVPARHGVPEITFVVKGRGFTVYFGGDTMLIPELRDLGKRFPSIDLMLPAINGLRVMGSQVVMNPEQAAELACLLDARVAVPTHYRFQGDWFTDTFILGRDGTPERFVAAAREKAPRTQVRVLAPGQTLTIARHVQASSASAPIERDTMRP